MARNKQEPFVGSVHSQKAVVAQVAHIYESDKALQDAAPDEDKQHFDRCIEFRDRRVGNPTKKIFGDVRSGEIPVRMLSPYLATMVHVFHRSAFEESIRLDLDALSQNEKLLTGMNHWESPNKWKRPWKLKHRFNRDGFLLYHEGSSSSDFCDQYIQFHDNGIVEAVDGELMGEVLHTHVIPANEFEYGLLSIIPHLVKAEELLAATLPLVISIGIRGRLEYTKVSYGPSDSPLHDIGIKDNLLVLPWVKIDSFHIDLQPVMRRCFDYLARAGGRSRSPNFDDHGKWIGPAERGAAAGGGGM
jgi:hypothetical protein